MHIHNVCHHVPEMLIRFRLLNERFLIYLHTLQTITRKQRLPIPARGFSDVVLRKPVDQSDIIPQ